MSNESTTTATTTFFSGPCWVLRSEHGGLVAPNGRVRRYASLAAAQEASRNQHACMGRCTIERLS